MTIDVTPEIEAKLKAMASTESAPVSKYVERIVCDEDARRIRLAEFTQGAFADTASTT